MKRSGMSGGDDSASLRYLESDFGYFSKAVIRSGVIKKDVVIEGANGGGGGSVDQHLLYMNENELGLKGDGATDDAPALQAAVQSNRIIVLRPDAIYSLGSTVVINGVSNFAIIGNGCKFVNDGQIQRLFQLQGTLENISFDNFRIEADNPGNPPFASGGMIDNNDTNDITNISFDRVHVYTSHGHAISFNNTDQDNEAASGKITNFRFTNGSCESLANNRYGLRLKKHCSRCLISDSRFIMNNKDGNNRLQSFNNLALYGGCEFFTVKGCYFEGGGHSPLACSPARFGTICNNVLNMGDAIGQSPVEEAGIEIEYKTTHGSTETSHDITVTANHVTGYEWSIMLRREDTGGDRPFNISIVGNTITDPVARGMSIDADKCLTITGNTISLGRSAFSAVTISSATLLVFADNIISCPVKPSGTTVNLDTANSQTGGALIANTTIRNNVILGVSNNTPRAIIRARDHNAIRISDNILYRDGGDASNKIIESSGNLWFSGNITTDNLDEYEIGYQENVIMRLGTDGNVKKLPPIIN